MSGLRGACLRRHLWLGGRGNHASHGMSRGPGRANVLGLATDELLGGRLLGMEPANGMRTSGVAQHALESLRIRLSLRRNVLFGVH